MKYIVAIALVLSSLTCFAAPSWLDNTLALQREIDINAPLNRATFLGTHNSENSYSYQIPFLRYLDPNQILSITEQLDAGIRGLEFDVHWFITSHLSYDVLLCHGLPNHVGCSPFDRPVTEGLDELRTWLDGHKQDVVILYFDRGTALDGHEAVLADYLQRYLGDKIYQPTQINQQSSCTSLPGTISKADVLKAGKQLLIITKDCDASQTAWNNWVFAGIGNVKSHAFNFIDSSIDEDFTDYPACSQTTTFQDDPDHTIPWRIYEDVTMVSNFEAPTRRITAQDEKTMVKCGINWQTFDNLTQADPRLRAAIWSWASGYPQTGAGNCAYYTADQGIKNTDCQNIKSAYACQDATTLTFQVATQTPNNSQAGESACQTQLGSTWHYAAPINGHEMELLRVALAQTGQTEVWLNYHTSDNAHWLVN